MGIADAIQQGPPPKERRCIFGKMIDGMQEADRLAVDNAIEKILKHDGHGYTISWLRNVMISEGFKVGLTTLSRHVGGECSCESK